MSTLREILGNSQYWGLTLSIAAYLFACWLKQKTKLAFLNPILVSVIVIISFLLGVGIDYDTYNKGASYLSWLLTPATVCLAIPLYKHYFRRCHQCSEYFPHVPCSGTVPHPLCNTASKVHYNCYWNGCQ